MLSGPHKSRKAEEERGTGGVVLPIQKKEVQGRKKDASTVVSYLGKVSLIEGAKMANETVADPNGEASAGKAVAASTPSAFCAWINSATKEIKDLRHRQKLLVQEQKNAEADQRDQKARSREDSKTSSTPSTLPSSSFSSSSNGSKATLAPPSCSSSSAPSVTPVRAISKTPQELLAGYLAPPSSAGYYSPSYSPRGRGGGGGSPGSSGFSFRSFEPIPPSSYSSGLSFLFFFNPFLF